MTEILACLDASAYAPSVCDHAAWFCGHARRAAVTLLHARDDAGRGGERLIAAARTRLADQGAMAGRARRPVGPLSTAVAAERADVVILGKRGEDSPEGDGGLGANAADVLRSCAQPLCLVSRVYLPIHRGLVLIDADPRHRRTVEAVAHTAALRELELDIVMIQPDGADGARKLAWARQVLGGARADIYAMDAAGPEALAAAYMAEHATDLIVFSREMMFGAPRAAPPERRPVWAWRTPVFVC